MYLPSPEEIRQATERIRNGWSKDEAKRRTERVKSGPGIKVISTRALSSDLSGEASGWHYLTDTEVTQKPVEPKKEIIEETEEERIERETFQATAVKFGE
jgi:hypothetical protein